jgi:hypothetical protein
MEFGAAVGSVGQNLGQIRAKAFGSTDEPMRWPPVGHVSCCDRNRGDEAAAHVTQKMHLEALEELILRLVPMASLWVGDADHSVGAHLPGYDQPARVIRLDVALDDTQEVVTALQQSLALPRPHFVNVPANLLDHFQNGPGNLVDSGSPGFWLPPVHAEVALGALGQQ